MKKLNLLLVLLLGWTTAVLAQDGPVLKFEKTQHDFGKIKEDGGPVAYTYKFTNTGNKPLKVERVQPGCGCTTPDWTKEEVKPGKEGFVKATFDPSGRPGTFSKSVTIYTNGTPNVSLITFSGEVIPRVKTIEDSFPSASGNLRYVLNHVNFGNVKNNVKDTVQEITMFNTGSKPITIKELRGPNYITTKLPFIVPVRQTVKFPLHYNATLSKDYGLLFEQMKLVTDDEKDPEKPISVIADIHQYVPPMTEDQKAKAPRLDFERKEHHFGDIRQGDVGNTTFKFTNKGKQELVIYKVKSTCGCTVADPEKKNLKPGETSEIKVAFHSAGKSGEERKDITIISNDPQNPESIITIRAKVLLPPTDKK